ncbi:MAG: MoxR family ATPase [Chitinophagaceae bacterium]|nr:MoxR family ATPase [Chitinophagaceae bacterium]
MYEDIFQPNTNITTLNDAVKKVKNEIGKVIIGQEKMIDLLLTGLLADGHILIEGVPGVAKTLAAKLLSRIIKVDFSRIQFTPDLMPGDVLGTSVFNPEKGSFEFKKGPIFSNIILIDEINRAPAKTQSALFEVMEERQVTIDGNTYKMSDPFLVLATQNPIEQEGTYRLPEAQLDRFLFKITVDYPGIEDEVNILKSQQSVNTKSLLESVEPVLNYDELKHFREMGQSVTVDPALMEYVAKIVHATRNNPAVFLGASPRASLAIFRTSKVWAAMKGRDFITPEDIIEMCIPVLRHRLMLMPEKEMEGISVDELVQQIISEIEVPR